jgi:ribosomal 50S subunit-recycling heat shock protein
MRVDVFLRLAGLVKTRSLAGKACGAGAVLVDGHRAKSASTLARGTILRLVKPDGTVITIEVLDIPSSKSVSRSERQNLFRLLDGEPSC